MAEPKGKEKASLDPTIEELQAKLDVPVWAMAGLKRAHGWGAGKRMSEREFQSKLDKWLRSPMAPRKRS